MGLGAAVFAAASSAAAVNDIWARGKRNLQLKRVIF